MTQVAIPDADTGFTTNWTEDFGGGDLYAAIDDGVAAAANRTAQVAAHDEWTFIQVEDMFADESCVLSLSDLSKPGAGDVKFTIAASTTDNMSAGQGPRLRVDLCETASFTVRATQIFTGIALTGGDSFTHYDSDALDVSSVSDDKWDELFVKLTMLNNGGGSDYMYVSQVFLITPDAGAAGPTANPAAFLLFLD